MIKDNIKVLVPGTCGELVQGTIDGISFHVTCPIDIYSEASFEIEDGCQKISFPLGRTKAAVAVKRTLQFLGCSETGGRLKLNSPLPLSKGMASSTADIAASIEATALALGKELDKNTIGQIALSVEPTDGCFFPGIVLFDHREGRLYEFLGFSPPMRILVLDFGGEIDTLEFNRIDRSALLQSLEPRFKEALDMVRAGLKAEDVRLIGEGASLSAITHQAVLPHPHLEKVMALAKDVRAAGVNIAHSGTVIGVLLDGKSHNQEEIACFLQRHFPILHHIIPCSLISGGSKICPSSK